jgi:hypothetical protein
MEGGYRAVIYHTGSTGSMDLDLLIKPIHSEP